MELFGVTAWQKKTSSRVLGSRWVSGNMPQKLEEEQGQLAGLPREKLLQAVRAWFKLLTVSLNHPSPWCEACL